LEKHVDAAPVTGVGERHDASRPQTDRQDGVGDARHAVDVLGRYDFCKMFVRAAAPGDVLDAREVAVTEVRCGDVESFVDAVRDTGSPTRALSLYAGTWSLPAGSPNRGRAGWPGIERNLWHLSVVKTPP